MKNYLYTATDEQGREYTFDVRRAGKSSFLTLPADKFKDAKELHILTSLSTAEAGDEGYYILPGSLRLKGSLQTFFTPREDCAFDVKDPTMTFYGIKKSDVCLLVRVERNYNLIFRGGVRGGKYFAEAYIDFAEEPPYDDIRVEVVELPLDADYNDMAVAQRKLLLARGEIVTLAEKCRRPAAEYGRKYPLIRIRMGWKQSPCVVEHQTPETEPEMLVACDFARVRDIADALKAKDVEGVELQLVGWNIGGHDGRFPQLLPPDPRLGGEDEFKKTVEHVKSLGYRISLHTNTLDSYEIADTFDWNDAVLTRSGEHKLTGRLSGGIAYRVCLKRQWKNTLRDLPPVAEYGTDGLHFTDVISIVVPDVCHAVNHPCTTADGIIYAQRIMEYTRDLFGGFSSEGCMDFSMKYLDYGLYVTFGDAFRRIEPPICDRYIPMFELIYHGITLYNPMSATVNYVVKDPASRLMANMNGGRPTFYFYSSFKSGGAVNWMATGSADLTSGTDAELDRSASIVAEGEREYRALRDRQLLFMNRYDFITDTLHVATYSDGSRMVGNYSDTPATYEGVEITAYGYVII